MARSPKIRKKKSFMFTTKHHSFVGIMGVVLFVLGISVLIISVLGSFSRHGQTNLSFGYYGFFAAILNLLGLFSGIVGIRERDAFIVAPWIAVTGNAFTLAVWLFLVVLSYMG